MSRAVNLHVSLSRLATYSILQEAQTMDNATCVTKRLLAVTQPIRRQM